MLWDFLLELRVRVADDNERDMSRADVCSFVFLSLLRTNRQFVSSICELVGHEADGE